jgi:putative tricarboxylic transport membrane protein
MRLSLDRYSALVFFALSAAYFVLAGDIELYPGSENDPINARTFPRAIGGAGMAIAFLMLIMPGARSGEAIDWRRLDWRRPMLLCGLMVAYGLAIKWPGFLVATTLFLGCGYAVLGERRVWMLLVASLPVAAAFEYLLVGVLGIYIVDPLLSAIGLGP